jgi:hypothetical protein
MEFTARRVNSVRLDRTSMGAVFRRSWAAGAGVSLPTSGQQAFNVARPPECQGTWNNTHRRHNR